MLRRAVLASIASTLVTTCTPSPPPSLAPVEIVVTAAASSPLPPAPAEKLLPAPKGFQGWEAERAFSEDGALSVVPATVAPGGDPALVLVEEGASGRRAINLLARGQRVDRVAYLSRSFVVTVDEQRKAASLQDLAAGSSVDVPNNWQRLVISEAQHRFASAAPDAVVVLDTTTGKKVFDLPYPRPEQNNQGILRLVDGDRAVLVTGHDVGALAVYDLAAGRAIVRASAQDVLHSLSGRVLLLGTSSDRRRELRAIDLRDGRELGRRRIPPWEPAGLGFSADERWVVAMDSEDALHALDLRDGRSRDQRRRPTAGRPRDVLELGVTDDGTVCAKFGDRPHETSCEAEALFRLDPPGPVTPDPSKVTWCFTDRRPARIVTLPRRGKEGITRPDRRVLMSFSDRMSAKCNQALSPDGGTVAFLESDPPVQAGDYAGPAVRLVLSDTRSGASFEVPIGDVPAGSPWSLELGFSPDGRVLRLQYGQLELLVDVRGQKLLAPPRRSPEKFGRYWSPGSRYLFGDKHPVDTIDLRTGQIVAQPWWGATLEPLPGLR